MPHFGDGVFQYGGAPVNLPLTIGNQPDPKVYFVNPDIGSDS